ncbi:MAG: hypothetical protein HQL15_02955 [Candidatus Omnitrophica bacterium]|nr:hypothetical protein [Candidatus Omnitrophota bacterium]
MSLTIFIIFLAIVIGCGIFLFLIAVDEDKEIRRLNQAIAKQPTQAQSLAKELEKFYQEKNQLLQQKDNQIQELQARLQKEHESASEAVKNLESTQHRLLQNQEDLLSFREEILKLKEEEGRLSESRLRDIQSIENEKQQWAQTIQDKESDLQKLGSEISSVELVLDTLALISKEMRRRLEEHYSKMRLLDEKTKENLELMAQLEY